MVLDKCPGAKGFHSPVPEFKPCPKCGVEIEVWSDEIKAVCPKCKYILWSDKATCLDWCKFAKECVGPDKLKKYLQEKAEKEKKEKEGKGE